MSCEALRCAACDKKVVRFADDVKWADYVDYMFVRNFNTSINRLREGVVPASGFSCYACQCSGSPLTSPQSVSTNCSSCAGTAGATD